MPSTTTRRFSRPLPKPPGAASTYEPSLIDPPRKQPLSPPVPEPLALPSFSSSPPTYSALIPPSSSKLLTTTYPPKQNPQRLFTMQSSRAKMSTAQQLYASSFTNHGPSVPSLPPPSLHTSTEDTGRNSLYKNQVASYVQPSPPARSPASMKCLPSNMSPQQASFVPQFSPYSERSFLDDAPRGNTAVMNARFVTNTTVHPRGRSGPDPYFRTSQTHETTPQPNRNTVYDNNLNKPAKSLFPLKYVDTQDNKPREVRAVTTTVKPPPNSGEPDVAHYGKASASSAFSLQTTVSPPPGINALGSPIHPTGTMTSTALSPMPTATPASHLPNVQPNVPLPPANEQSQYQQQYSSPTAPVRPQSMPLHVSSTLQPPPPQPTQQQSHPQPHCQQSHPQHQQSYPQQQHPHHQQSHPQHQQLHLQQQQPLRPLQNPQPPQISADNPRPPQPAKPNKQSSGLLSSFASGFANQLGQTAAKLGTQVVLSNIGLGDDDEEDDGGGGGDTGWSDASGNGEPAPPQESLSPTVGGYMPPSQDPGAYYVPPPQDPSAYYVPPPSESGVYYPPFQDPGMAAASPPQPVNMEYQTTYSTGVQYTSYSVGLPTFEYHHHPSGNNHGGHGNHGGSHNAPNGH